jgi:hypothetical protein
MCLSVLNTVISFTHDSQAQLFAEFRVPPPPLCVTFHLSWQGECATGNENIPVSLRNFKGWGLLSLSEDSCQNYSVIVVTLNALHIYILPVY